TGPAAYWPLTDGENTQNAISPVGGNIAYLNSRTGEDITQPMQWADFDIAPHLEPVATLPDKADRGVFRGYLLPGHRPAAWSADFVRGGVGGFDSFGMALKTAGTDVDPTRIWYVAFDHTTKSIGVSYFKAGDSSANTTIVRSDFAVPEVFEPGGASVVRFEVAPTGTRSAWRLHVNGTVRASGTHSEPAKPPLRWLYDWWVPDDDIAEHASLGHITVWDASTAPESSDVLLAYHGYEGETAGARLARMSEETGVPLAFVGDPADTQTCGPQEIESPLAIMSSAANADGGILYEDRAEPTLVYRTNRSRYNRGYLLPEE